MTEEQKLKARFLLGQSGFRITFENGYSVSTQFGPFNYCENRNENSGFNSKFYNKNDEPITSSNAEIAVMDRDQNLLQILNDGVAGWVDADSVFKIMMCVRRFNPKNESEASLIEIIEQILDGG